MGGVFLVAALSLAVVAFVQSMGAGNRKRAWQAQFDSCCDLLHAVAMNEYRRMFICLKCGNTFKGALTHISRRDD